MSSFWHRTVLGKYSPEDRWVGLDFRNLFLDSLATKLTHVHELAHSVLSRSTDFGQATEVIYQLLPKMTHLSSEDKDRIRLVLRNAQYFTQEGSACLMEMLNLKRYIGREKALVWAKEHYPPDYYDIAQNFFFVLELGERHRDCFTQQILHTAMHTAIRTSIVEKDLLSNADKFIEYLENDDNNPDKRLTKMLETIKYKTYISTKSPQEICETTAVKYFGDVSKKDAADFLSYVYQKAGNDLSITAEMIKDSKDIDVLSEANDQILIANMNLNIQKDAIPIWKLDDILHYQDVVEAVIINRMSDDLEHRDLLEALIGKKLEAGLIAFTKTGEKYLTGSDFNTIASLVDDGFKNTTLLVKWGLYKPGDNNLAYFSKMRKPDVVLYNYAKNLDDNFSKYLSKGKKAQYLFIGASKDHPFQILVLKDSNGVLHLLNTFNKPANDFLSKYSSMLIASDPKSFLSNTKHYNNAMAIWGGMPFEVDWYKSMLDGENIHLR